MSHLQATAQTPHAVIVASVRRAAIAGGTRRTQAQGAAARAQVIAEAARSQITGHAVMVVIEENELMLMADAPLGGHRAVYRDGMTARYADAFDLDHVDAIGGITAHAAASGEAVRVRYAGELVEPSWNWTPSEPVFLGIEGALVQTPDPAGATVEIGIATAPNRVLVRIQSAIYPPV